MKNNKTALASPYQEVYLTLTSITQRGSRIETAGGIRMKFLLKDKRKFNWVVLMLLGMIMIIGAVVFLL